MPPARECAAAKVVWIAAGRQAATVVTPRRAGVEIALEKSTFSLGKPRQRRACSISVGVVGGGQEE